MSKELEKTISELKTAFEIGFIIYVPFIVLDLVVANILLALGMFMLSPQIVSTPFKLLISIVNDLTFKSPVKVNLSLSKVHTPVPTSSSL